MQQTTNYQPQRKNYLQAKNYQPACPAGRCATTTNANSLLIAILIMGIITFLGIGINTLIIKQIRVEHDAITAGKAYFFAEAAIEQALLEIDNNLPGYERKKGTKREPYIQEDGKYDYAIHSQNLSSPCNFKKLGSTEPKDLKWQKLELNESITIPLYKVNDEGKKVEIKDFTVFYFVDRGSQGIGNELPIGDILRWKIIGQTNDFKTEAVSEYIPMDSSCNAPKDIKLNDKNTRYGEFGTELTRAMDYGEYTHAKYYYKDPGSDEYKFVVYKPIKDFLDNHKNNTLILTNIIDISKQIYTDGEYTTKEENVIFFKVATPEGKKEDQVCLTSHIIANGYADNFKQSMDVNIKPDSFMPVFDFALYRTKVE